MAQPYPKEDHLIGNFAPIRMESNIDDVIVEGEIPNQIIVSEDVQEGSLLALERMLSIKK